MSNRFVISDTHLGHEKTWSTFKRKDGTPLRPFTSTEEMDETMVDNWNKIVHPKDTVYHLGDVVIARKNLQTVKRLNGRKILIRGNHDPFKDKDYYEVGFEQIHGVRVFVDKFILSHIPLHPDCITERYKLNVHGHLHSNRIMKKVYKVDPSGMSSFLVEDVEDPLYFCVSVEQINYSPLPFESIPL